MRGVCAWSVDTQVPLLEFTIHNKHTHTALLNPTSLTVHCASCQPALHDNEGAVLAHSVCWRQRAQRVRGCAPLTKDGPLLKLPCCRTSLPERLPPPPTHARAVLTMTVSSVPSMIRSDNCPEANAGLAAASASAAHSMMVAIVGKVKCGGVEKTQNAHQHVWDW